MEYQILDYLLFFIAVIFAFLVFMQYAKTKEKDLEVKQSIIDYYKRKQK